VSEPTDELRVYSTWRGRVVAFASPLALAALGLLAIAARGVHVLSFVLVVIGGFFLVVSLFDFPISTSFDSDGIVRRTVLRAHRLPWPKVTAITRAPGSRMKPRRARGPGPLTATIGRRRYLLIDCTEGSDEYDALRARVYSVPGGPLMQAEPPGEGTAPTWMYHRRPSSSS
jgi:hypothetical protein